MKEKKDDADHITIAVQDRRVQIQKDLLILTSPLMRDILTSHPVTLEPLLIFPNESFDSEAVKKLSDLFFNADSSSDFIIMRDEVRNDINLFMDLIQLFLVTERRFMILNGRLKTKSKMMILLH